MRASETMRRFRSVRSQLPRTAPLWNSTTLEQCTRKELPNWKRKRVTSVFTCLLSFSWRAVDTVAFSSLATVVDMVRFCVAFAAGLCLAGSGAAVVAKPKNGSHVAIVSPDTLETSQSKVNEVEEPRHGHHRDNNDHFKSSSSANLVASKGEYITIFQTRVPRISHEKLYFKYDFGRFSALCGVKHIIVIT